MLPHMSAGREQAPLARLGGLLMEWVDTHHLTLGQAADRIGISAETLRLIRNNHYDDLKPDTKRKIDAALGWKEGYGVDNLRAGLDPTPDEPEVQADVADRPADARNDAGAAPRRLGGASPEDVLNHLQVAYQLGGPDYFWQAMVKMNRLHNPAWVEPVPPRKTDRSA